MDLQIMTLRELVALQRRVAAEIELRVPERPDTSATAQAPYDALDWRL